MTTAFRWIMRPCAFAFGVFATAGLAACAGPGGLTSRMLSNLAEIPPPPHVQVSAASDRLQVGIPKRGVSGAMGMISDQFGVTEWRSADGIGLTLKDGQIIATRGFGPDLLIADTDAAAIAVRRGHGTFQRHMHHLDGESRDVDQLFNCSLTEDTQQTVHGERAMTETCVGVSQSFQNTYVLTSPGGQRVRSSQWVSTELGSITLAQF